MALWPSRARAAVEDVHAHTRQVEPGLRIPPLSLVPSWDQWQSYRSLWAMQVPAFNRGVRLISGTVAQLPLTEWDTYGGIRRQNTFLAQISATRPYWATMQATVKDLILFGKAYWQVTGTRDGYPTYADHVPFDAVTSDGTTGRVYVNGEARELSDPAGNGTAVDRIIEFTGFADGVLLTGQEALSAALALEVAAGNYAAAPAPTQILKNTSNYELSDTEIDELLAAYTDARKASAVAYLNGGVDLTTFGYSAQDLQLVEARNQSAIQIARLLNLDPFWVGAGVPGSALTYQNRVDMRQDLVDLTLSDYLNPIEQRLSMPDVMTTPWKNRARFDLSEFLRSNLDTRARMAIDLFTAGIIDQDAARDFISEQPTGGPAS